MYLRLIIGKMPNLEVSDPWIEVQPKRRTIFLDSKAGFNLSKGYSSKKGKDRSKKQGYKKMEEEWQGVHDPANLIS